MRWSTSTLISVLAASGIASAAPQAAPVGATAPATAAAAKLAAPANCKKLPVDADWPSEQVWKAELKGAEPRGPQKAWTQPDYTYEAGKAAHVQNAVRFAAKYNLRLSVMNSGHDFVGRNDAPSGIRLTVGDIKGIRVLESFTPTPKGAEPVDNKTKLNKITPVPGKQAAVTIGAGININELNKGLRVSGLYAIGAAHGEVSVAGGWSQGGGHAPLSSYFGLGVDQILEYKVVTADGNLVIANAVSNPDLFWALRGGGPSTFGVVVEATVKAYPNPKILSYAFWMNTTDYDDKKSIFPAAAYMHTQLPRLSRDGGFAGYYYIHPNAISGTFLAPNEYANATKITEFWDPIVKKMSEMPGMDPKTLIKNPPVVLGTAALGGLQGSGGGAAGLQENMGGKDHKGMNMLFRRHGPGEKTAMSRGRITLDSRLLGEAELTHPQLAAALEAAMPKLANAQLRSHLTAGGKVLQGGNETSVLPAWRKAYVHMIATGLGTPNLQALRDISPGMGAYVNEAWYANPNWKQDFWGANYPRLSEIKSKWDPDMLFYVTPGINADHMVARDGRLCKHTGPPIRTPSNVAPVGDNVNNGEHDKATVTFPLLYAGKGVPPVRGTRPRMSGAKGPIPQSPATSPQKGN